MNFDLSQPMVLRPSRLKVTALIVLSVVFVVVGIMMVRSGGATAVKGWFGLIFFGLMGIVFVGMLLPGSCYLRLDPNGFTMCTLYRKSFTPWSKVRNFGVTRVWRRVVGVNLEPDASIGTGIRRVNRVIAGYDNALPDTYGMKVEALAELMNQALAQAKARAEGGQPDARSIRNDSLGTPSGVS
jgi:hypothetical protein